MAAAPGKKPPAPAAAPGPGEKTEQELEEEMAAERELADDAQWKIIQKNTFTRWANEHLKTAKMVIIDLEKDLSDGLRLIGLIEVLSGKKFGKYNKKPTFRTQKFENVTQSLRFLEQSEGIKIVNIGLSSSNQSFVRHMHYNTEYPIRTKTGLMLIYSSPLLFFVNINRQLQTHQLSVVKHDYYCSFVRSCCTLSQLGAVFSVLSLLIELMSFSDLQIDLATYTVYTICHCQYRLQYT